jgi:hypothetical protein
MILYVDFGLQFIGIEARNLNSIHEIRKLPVVSKCYFIKVIFILLKL